MFSKAYVPFKDPHVYVCVLPFPAWLMRMWDWERKWATRRGMLGRRDGVEGWGRSSQAQIQTCLILPFFCWDTAKFKGEHSKPQRHDPLAAFRSHASSTPTEWMWTEESPHFCLPLPFSCELSGRMRVTAVSITVDLSVTDTHICRYGAENIVSRAWCRGVQIQSWRVFGPHVLNVSCHDTLDSNQWITIRSSSQPTQVC